MKIFPKSSTLTDLVNYINNRTDSHQKVYDFFKNIVLSSSESTSVDVNFTENSKYFNGSLPIDENGYVLRPQDMFGGKALKNYPILTSFNAYPSTTTVPNILEGKPELSIKIDQDIPSTISLDSNTIANLSNATSEKIEKIKYWPTIKIGDFYPISSGYSNIEQNNINGNSASDSIFSILNIVDELDTRYHHIDIEYSVTGPKMIVLVLLDGSHIIDGQYVDFKVSFRNIDGTEELNKWPLVLFIDSTYTNISIEKLHNNSTLSLDRQSLVIDGIAYRYVQANGLNKYQYPYIRIPQNESLGYLIAVDSVNQDYLNNKGNSTLINFDGNSNSIKFNDYGYLNNEILRIDNNENIMLVTRPIIGKPTDILKDSSIVFSKDQLKLITTNNGCAVFGASTNKYGYDLSTYSTSTTLESNKVVTDYLPIDYPRQFKEDFVTFNSQIDSGIFYTFDITSDQIGTNYYVLKSGIQFIDSSFTIRKHTTEILVEYASTVETITTSLTSISLDFGFKRIKNVINKRLVLRYGTANLFDSGWIADLSISAYDCQLLSNTSPFIEILSVSDLNTSHPTNTITLSNILIYHGLERSEVDSLFELSSLDGVHSRFNNVLTPIYKILPVSQIEGLLNSINQYPVSNMMMTQINEDNSTYGSVEYRVGYTAHENKGNFKYRSKSIQSVNNSDFLTGTLVDVDSCGDHSIYNNPTSIDCDGVLTVEKLPYFTGTVVTNRTNSKSLSSKYGSKILNKKTLISFTRCGYVPSVKSVTEYDHKYSEFYFDRNDWYGAYSGGHGTTQSFNFDSKTLSEDTLNVDNTLNRVLYYWDSLQTLTTPGSNLNVLFGVNYGDTVDIFGKTNDPLSSYRMIGCRFDAEIFAPDVNTTNYLQYSNVPWELRYITKNIDSSTVTFSDIDLILDTVIISEVAFSAGISLFGTPSVPYSFKLMFDDFNTDFDKIPMQYIKNGLLVTLKTEHNPDTSVTINTDGTNLIKKAEYFKMGLEVTSPITFDKFEYIKLPDEPTPTFTAGQSDFPKGLTTYKSLDSEYIKEFNDIPTINRWMLSTFYQIPKYSR